MIAVSAGIMYFHFQVQHTDSTITNIQALSRTGSSTNFQAPASRYSLSVVANLQEAYWISGDDGQPVAVHEIIYTIYNQGTEPETVALALCIDESQQSIGTLFIPAGDSRSGSTKVQLGEGNHSIQIVAESARSSTYASVSIPNVSFGWWPTEVRMPPKVSVAVSPPSLMYLGYENYFAVSITNSGGPASVEVRAGSHDYTIQLGVGETQRLDVPQVADDLGDGSSDVYYDFNVNVSASNIWGSDTESGFANARVVQKPVEIWYSPLELEESQSFRTNLKDFFTSKGTISLVAGWAGETIGGAIGGAVAGPIGEFVGAQIGRWLGESAAPEAGEWGYVAQSPSVEYMLRQLERHDNRILNLKEVYYFVRDQISYDYGKMGDPFLGFTQTFGFAIQHPVETLALRRGICLDKAILLASMLEAQGYDAALVYTTRGSIGHAFTAIYLPGHGLDHPISGVKVPYGNSEDWLYLDAVSKGIEFGEDWTYEAGFLSYEIVDVKIGEVKPSLQMIDFRWSIDGEKATEAKVGDKVRAELSLMASGGDISEDLSVHIYKGDRLWFDEEYQIEHYFMEFRRGEITSIEIEFEPFEAADSWRHPGYYVVVQANNQKIWTGPTLPVCR